MNKDEQLKMLHDALCEAKFMYDTYSVLLQTQQSEKNPSLVAATKVGLRMAIENANKIVTEMSYETIQ